MTVVRQRLVLICGAALLAACPTLVNAAEITFVNNLKMTVNIEATSIVRGRLIRDVGLLIAPGKAARHPNVPPGPRVIHVFDPAAPGKLLFKVGITVNNPAQKILFSVQMVRPPQGGPPRPALVPR